MVEVEVVEEVHPHSSVPTFSVGDRPRPLCSQVHQRLTPGHLAAETLEEVVVAAVEEETTLVLEASRTFTGRGRIGPGRMCLRS